MAAQQFVCIPALLSHDAFVYAGYGRLLIVYHANPYFVPFSAHWHDPIYQYDDWGSYTAVAPADEWNLGSAFFTFAPPVAAFLIALLPWQSRSRPIAS